MLAIFIEVKQKNQTHDQGRNQDYKKNYDHVARLNQIQKSIERQRSV